MIQKYQLPAHIADLKHTHMVTQNWKALSKIGRFSLFVISFGCKSTLYYNHRSTVLHPTLCGSITLRSIKTRSVSRRNTIISISCIQLCKQPCHLAWTHTTMHRYYFVYQRGIYFSTSPRVTWELADVLFCFVSHLSACDIHKRTDRIVYLRGWTHENIPEAR